MRYGHQPYSECLEMTPDEIGMYCAALSAIVSQENDSGKAE